MGKPSYAQIARAKLELRKLKTGETPTQKQRKSFINEKYSELGGKPALERIKKYGRNEDGESIHWHPWFEEFVEALADFRLAHVLTTGSAQIGKTIGNTLVEVDTIVHGRCQTAWFYADAQAVDLNVPDQFRPVVEKYVELYSADTGRKFNRKIDRMINSRYEVEAIGGIFSFANTSISKPSRTGKAAAGSKGVSFHADAVFYEEKSQWMTNVDYSARMNASVLPSHPVRELGTPGSGSGVEAGMQDCDRYFYPHYQCPHCSAIKPLSPKGCLLKPVETKSDKVSYLSVSGRPVKWYHHDEADAVNSAFIACSECDRPLPDEVRLNARFFCIQSGVSLREFLDSLPDGVPDRRLKVGIHLSPLVRQTQYNLAASLINDGIQSGSAEDFQQQKLGFPSETLTTSLTLEILKRSLYAPPTARRFDVILAGIDQGVSQHWLWIAGFSCPGGYQSMPAAQVIDKTIQTVLFAGEVIKTEIPAKLEQYRVKHGVIDNEPGRDEAADLARSSCLVLGDQKPGQLNDVREIIVETGGIKHKAWGIANEIFLKRVLNSFLLTDTDGYPLQRLPRDWEKWINNNSELSPLRHLSGPSLDPESGKWSRGPGNVDDLYYACMFTQAAFYLWLTGKFQGDYVAGLGNSEQRITSPAKRRH